MTQTGTLVLNNGTLTIGAQDFSSHLVQLDISSTAGVLDVGTFANPYRQAIGRAQYGIVATFIWSEDLINLIDTAGGLDTDLTLVFTPNTAAGAVTDGNFACSVRINNYPYGTFKVGEKVEVDLPMAIVGDITWTDSADA